MELNYYRLTFDNQQEFFVASEKANESDFLNTVSEKGLFSGNAYIILKLSEESDPVYIKATKLFSIQRARKGVIGAQTKLWRLA